MWSLSLRASTGGALRSCSDCRNHSLLLGYPLWLLELMASKLYRLTSSVRVKSCETLWVWRTGPDIVQQWAEYLHYLWFGRQPCIGHSLISAWWRLVTLITHKVHAPGPMSILGSVIDFLFIFHWLYQLLLSIQPLQNSHHHKTQVRRETPVRSQVLVGGRLNTRWVKEIRTSQVVRVLRRKKNTMKQWSMLGDSVRLCGPRWLSWRRLFQTVWPKTAVMGWTVQPEVTANEKTDWRWGYGYLCSTSPRPNPWLVFPVLFKSLCPQFPHALTHQLHSEWSLFCKVTIERLPQLIDYLMFS